MKNRLYNIYGTICGVIVAVVVLTAVFLGQTAPEITTRPSPIPRSIASQLTP